MADSHFAWLLDGELLICQTCGNAGTLLGHDDALRCSACEATVPIVSGVPDFFAGYVADRNPDVLADPSVIDDITGILDLPSTDDVRATITTALQQAERDTDVPALTAEIREVHARFVGGEIEEPPLPEDANSDPTARIERHYAPKGFVSGERRFVNVRFHNVGSRPWSSRTSPIAITAGARFRRKSFGRRTTSEPVYTPLPIDITPGRAITLPVEVVVPERQGTHELEIGLVRHPDGFLPDATIVLDVNVHPDGGHPETRPLPSGVGSRLGTADYGEDHRIANEMVGAAMERCWPGVRRRMVEIGGSTHPQSWNHRDTDLVNIDISAPTLHLGVLYDRHHDRSIAHLCADAMAPPLAQRAWHAVAMYATLHHFAEPERLLAAAEKLLLPGGFVAVMCEPSGTTLAHPAGVRDLLGGINEQTFAVDEYLWMAARAGLTVDEAFDDGGSFKAILRAS
jgi:SAM-dependent methyltransferase